jgi:ABC-type multidrug transport system ATPase subunit
VTNLTSNHGIDEPALRVTRLRKQYGSIVAVDDVSCSVSRGEIVGLLGPNGAGETTTINMILGVLEPTAGHITIDGIDLAKSRGPHGFVGALQCRGRHIVAAVRALHGLDGSFNVQP